MSDNDMRSTFEVALAAANDLAPAKMMTATPEGRLLAIIPDTFNVVDTTDKHVAKLRGPIEESPTFFDQNSFVTYLKRFARNHETLVFADIDTSQIRAVLDYHNAEGEQPVKKAAEHSARLNLRSSEEFKRWDSFAMSSLRGQAEFSEFLDENAFDVVDPEPGVLREIARDFEVSRDATFKAKYNPQSGDRMLVASEESKTRNIVVPQKITINIPFYRGEEPVEIQMLFRYRINDGVLKLGLLWHRMEYQRQAVFDGIANSVAEETGLTVLFGTR